MDEKKPEKTGESSAAPESIYENFNKVPLKVLDLIIGLCTAALIAVIVMGVLNR